MLAESRANVRHNMVVNVTDGAFFGFGLSFASFITVIPLYIATLTDSEVIIGVIASLHLVGWQLPQLLTANRVARLKRYKPMVLFMLLHERLPFFALAVVALLIPTIGREWALLLSFILITWHSLGGGLAGTAWQSMIAKIMPLDRRGTFYGLQSAAANLFGSGGAVLAGLILRSLESPQNFAVCFFLTSVFWMFSFGFLAWTREPETPVTTTLEPGWRAFSGQLKAILSRDKNFRWFIVARILAQLAAMAASFYTIYAVRRFDMDAGIAGVMTGLLMLAQVVSNLILGWLGDRWSHRMTFAIGALVMMTASLLALIAPSLNWFYVIFALSGFANPALWATTMALNSEFGSDTERPYYIGLGNTLVAPATLFAPVLGGALADVFGFSATFSVAFVSGLLAAFVLAFVLRNPRGEAAALAPAPARIATSTE